MPKTKLLVEKFEQILGHKEKAIFVTPKAENQNFMWAQESLKNVKVVNPNEVNILDLVVHDKVIFTVESLQEFTELLLAVAFQKEKPKWVTSPEIDEFLNVNFRLKDAEPQPIFDPEEGFESNFSFLESYYEEYHKMMNESQFPGKSQPEDSPSES